MSVRKRTKAEKAKVDRDRTHLSSSEVSEVLRTITEKMTCEEVIYTLRQLEEFWRKEIPGSTSTQLLWILLSKLQYIHKVKIEFPSQYLAANLSDISDRLNVSTRDAEKRLKEKGFILCNSEFGKIGMKLASDELLEVKPDAFKSPTKTSLDNCKHILTQTLEELTKALEKATPQKEAIDVTPQVQIRFNVLQSCLKALGAHFSVIHFNPLKDPTLTLGKENNFDTKFDFKTRHHQHVIQVAPLTLHHRSLEQALFQIIATPILKKVAQDSADYTYTLTDLSVELARMFLTSKQLRDQYADLRAVWELSWHPDDIVEQLKAVSTQ
jgi:hypothetical protein